MKFSTRSTYGLRAMINLAQHWNRESVPLSFIAHKENISQKYLERLFAKLKKAKLVKAEKGVSGGYKLAKKPELVSIYEIVKVLEGGLNLFHCLGEDGKIYCNNKCGCGVTIVLAKVQKAVNEALKNIKLNDLIK